MLLCYVKLSASLVPLVPPSGALDRTRLRSKRGAPREPKVFIRGTAAKIKDSSRCVNDRTRLRSKRYPSGRQRVRSKWVPLPQCDDRAPPGIYSSNWYPSTGRVVNHPTGRLRLPVKQLCCLTNQIISIMLYYYQLNLKPVRQEEQVTLSKQSQQIS